MKLGNIEVLPHSIQSQRADKALNPSEGKVFSRVTDHNLSRWWEFFYLS